jgi:hypothetical protein
MYLEKEGLLCVYWIHLAQNREQWLPLVITVMSLRVSRRAGNFYSNWRTVSYSRKSLLHEISQLYFILIKALHLIWHSEWFLPWSSVSISCLSCRCIKRPHYQTLGRSSVALRGAGAFRPFGQTGDRARGSIRGRAGQTMKYLPDYMASYERQ